MRRPLTTSRSSALADKNTAGTSPPRFGKYFTKEARMQAKLRMNEKKDNASVAKAEHRSVEYGSPKEKSKK